MLIFFTHVYVVHFSSAVETSFNFVINTAFAILYFDLQLMASLKEMIV